MQQNTCLYEILLQQVLAVSEYTPISLPSAIFWGNEIQYSNNKNVLILKEGQPD